MNLAINTNKVEIRGVSDYWAGIASKKNISKGEIIEICPVIILDKNSSNLVKQTKLLNICSRFNGGLILPGGYGSVYLPSENPNADYEILPKQRKMIIKALKNIHERESIYVNRGVLDLDKIKEGWNIPSFWNSEGLEVKLISSKGFGTFTTRAFKKGENIETCALFSLTGKESKLLEETCINNYVYSFGCKNQLSGWAVGYPCFYNHSKKNPNVDYGANENDFIEWEHISFTALRDLEPGTEILFDYLPDGDEKDLGFKVL